MRVLVTGAAGFLGQAVVAALARRGDAVTGFDHRPLPPSMRHVAHVVGDITDAAGVDAAIRHHRPEAVIHCAALVGVVAAVSDAASMVRVNVEGAVNLFEAMRRQGVRRCVHVSSEEVYGHFLGSPIDESHPLDPILPYGICKLAVEHLGRTWRDLHGLEIVDVRTSWVYGPGLPRMRIPRNLIEAALERRPLHLEFGADTAIDHTYVDDTVSGLLAALDHPHHRFHAYNIASGRATTVAGMIGVIRELVPGADLSAGPGTYRYADRIEIVRKGALDVSRAAAELGWRPQFDIRAGLSTWLRVLQSDQGGEPDRRDQ